ncbi:hypothetical protein KY46_09940 [Photobacterium halotolerans]|uniref:Uncharacterized protein n=1 Tax=Photobacterium halotolerans TaxID=265726 RepID=A0A0F5VCP5_9GAMM|nr:hypothetical protein KY46_09940 [Photobacterium halotolerans]
MENTWYSHSLNSLALMVIPGASIPSLALMYRTMHRAESCAMRRCGAILKCYLAQKLYEPTLMRLITPAKIQWDWPLYPLKCRLCGGAIEQGTEQE